MPLVQVVASAPRAGKSTVAAGLAQGLARAGVSVRLMRAGESDAARADASAFSELLFAASPTTPISAGQLTDDLNYVSLVELDAGAGTIDAPAIIVVRGAPNQQDEALARAVGQRLIGTVATLVPVGQTEAVARDLTNGGLRPLAILPEDRRLAAPSIEDMRHALAADVLYEGDNLRAPIENVLVAPVYTDGAKTHFRRFPGSKAILAPSYKTDLLLAAIEAAADCVVITGGHRPSHYLIDRVQHEPTTLLLAQLQTPAAITALSDVWTASAFAGETKAEAIFTLLDSRLDWTSLANRLQ